MEPPIESSIRKVNDQKWLVGREHICQRVELTIPKSTIAHWRDSSGQVFCLRKAQTRYESTLFTPFYSAGMTAALWEFAGKIWKVKASLPNMQMEGETIGYVKARFPNIPTPKVVHFWLDETDHRSFLILERESGSTLDSIWASLTHTQRESVAATIAGYTKELATSQRSRLETTSGYGLADEIIQPIAILHSWRPSLIRLGSIEEANGYFHPMDVGQSLVLYHGDLNALNILVDNNGKVTCLLDWESAGYVPRWWIYFKAHLWAMTLSDERFTKSWIEYLSNELEKSGIHGDLDACSSWVSG